MIKVSSIISVIVLGLAIVVIGAAIGMLYTGSFQGVIILESERKNIADNNASANYGDCDLFKKLASSVFIVSARGRFKSVEDQKIILEANNDTTSFDIEEDTKMFYLEKNSSGKLTGTQFTKIDKIKPGDFVDITLKLLKTGKLEILSLMVTPQ